jgi:uncharacterized protein YdaU (DUF1376 family)
MKSPAMPLLVQDFDMDTAAWDNDEVGAYLRLLMYEWANKNLPDDVKKLAKIARESRKKFEKKWKNFSHKFVPDGNGNLVNLKLESVRGEKQKFLDSQREKGIKSGEARRNRGSNRGSTGVRTGSELSFSSSFSSNTTTNTISPSGDMSPDESGDAFSSEIENCPHKAIIELYHQTLPSLPRVKEWTDERQKLLRTRWKEKLERQNLDWWKALFEYVSTCDFLMGRTKNVFYADLEWLVRPKNLVRVIEGKYRNRNQQQPFVSPSSAGILTWAQRKKQEMEHDEG